MVALACRGGNRFKEYLGGSISRAQREVRAEEKNVVVICMKMLIKAVEVNEIDQEDCPERQESLRKSPENINF